MLLFTRAVKFLHARLRRGVKTWKVYLSTVGGLLEGEERGATVAREWENEGVRIQVRGCVWAAES